MPLFQFTFQEQGRLEEEVVHLPLLTAKPHLKLRPRQYGTISRIEESGLLTQSSLSFASTMTRITLWEPLRCVFNLQKSDLMVTADGLRDEVPM